MPKGKSYRRAQATKRQRAAQRPLDVQPVAPRPVGVHGTGERHSMNTWPVSPYTGKRFKLAMPALVPDKQFVLLVGDSHLRSVADLVVKMPEGKLSFGVFSVPGGCSSDLKMDLQHCVLTRAPDAVCILAPSNDIERKTIGEASVDFNSLLASACSRFTKVFVVDFPPRLNVPLDLQDVFRQEYRRVAACLGVQYFSTAEHLPVRRLDLWCRDGVHLSDRDGMAVLTQLLWMYAYQTLETTTSNARSPPRSSPPARTFVPRIVVTGDVVGPRQLDPSKWTVLGPGRKRTQVEQPSDDVVVPKKFVLQPECSSLVTSNHFSILEDSEDSSHLPSPVEEPAVPEGTKKPNGTAKKRGDASKKTQAKLQGGETSEPSATSDASLVVHGGMAAPGLVGVTSPSPTSGVLVAEQASTEKATLTTVVSAEPSPIRAVDERVQEHIKAKAVFGSNACMCSEKLQSPVVAGTDVRAASVCSSLIACSVVAGVRHVLSPVCTWRSTDFTDIRIEASKLDMVCNGVGQYSVFGRMWDIDVGLPLVTYSESLVEDCDFFKTLQEHLLRDKMCLLNIRGEACAVIHHSDYYVVVDCSTRDASGLAADFGTSVAVYNTCLNDLMLHVSDLKRSLNASWCSIRSLSVRERQVQNLMNKHRGQTVDTVDFYPVTFGAPSDDFECVKEAVVAPVSGAVEGVVVNSCVTRESANFHVTGELCRWFDRSVSGSFHQGNSRFKYAGNQCVAIGLVGITKHTVHSVFSWCADDLDQVVVEGDRVYTSLRDRGLISGSSNLLIVPDLPKELDFDSQLFDCWQGDFVSGVVHVVDGPNIQNGTHVSLVNGLEKMFANYDTCFLTLNDSTCIIIRQNKEFAVVDSHARSVCGMCDPNGKSVIVYFSRLKDVHAHICSLANSLCSGQTQFEISGFHVVPKCTVSCDEAGGAALDCSIVSTVESVQGCVSTDNSDVEFVSEATFTEMQFDPIRKEVSQVLCSKLKVPFVKLEKLDPLVSLAVSLGRPCTKEKIVGDGNCFFRAVSQAVSGSQENHGRVRRAIVNHLKKNAVDYENMLRCEYSSVAQYISTSKMYCLGTWATEVEIQATADVLGVSIFTYLNDRWLEYKCRNRCLSKQAIYLENSHGNHFETVVCVYQSSLESCFGHCKVSQGYNARRRSKVDFSPVLSPAVTVNKPVVQAVYIEDEMERQSSVVDEASKAMFTFTPLCIEDAKRICSICDLEFQKQGVKDHTVYGSLGAVCKSTKTVENGNSFFSALSEVICGSPKGHRKIRLAVVKYMESHSIDMQKFLEKDYISVAQYLKKSRMNYVGTKATALEIQATANAFGVDIFIFRNAEWVKYSSIGSILGEGIYLRQYDNNHFESVVCVHGVDKNLCFGLCSPDLSAKPQYMLRRNSEMQAKSKKCDGDAYSSSRNYCYSNYLKRKVNFRIKMYYNSKDIAAKKKLYHQNELFRETKKAVIKTKYRQNVTFRENQKAIIKTKYRQNETFRENQKAIIKTKYRQNETFRENQKAIIKTKYRQNETFRENQKAIIKTKYRQNETFRENQKAIIKTKYCQNETFRENQKAIIKTKYCQNETFRENQKAIIKTKYRKSEAYRQKAKAYSTRQYHGNPVFKKRVTVGNKLKRQQIRDKSKDFNFVMEQFLKKVKDGPDFICSVCYRILFKHQVLKCNKDNYKMRRESALIADLCISDAYLHKCSGDCVMPCQWLESSRGQLWICHTCHNKIKKGQVPAECAQNNLAVHPIPRQLACLNSLEQHLIALHIPFMKLLALPKGSQSGVHGPCSCVPANIVQTSNLLPRSDMEDSLIQVKLKRKLTYKGHYEFLYVDTMRIRQALQYLKEINVYYKDVVFNDSWINDLSKHPDSDLLEKDKESVETSADVNQDEHLYDKQQHCMFQDTVLYPVDIGQESLDQYFEDILNLAPAEGNSPVKLLSDPTNEAKCFPVLFPNGCSTYHDSRQHRLTLSRYFNNRILHADGRFAQNVEYIFFAQYMSEVQQVVSNVSIALRKGKGGCETQKVSGDQLNEESLKKFLEFDDGFRFLKPIRGTPSFWAAAQRDLLACVRQLGIPTWFASFSSADLRWKNLLDSILKQEGRTETAEELEWADRCNLLRRNPVTAARMFDFRWHCFLREVLMSPSNPIGKILDYFYRVEFQQRGSPHVHCLFWIENAPVIDINTDEEVIEFIDKYITCEIPSEDEHLKDIVTSVQQHSKRHSKTCKKNKTVCRFNFPRPASARTFICRELSDDFTCTCKVDETDELPPCRCAEAQKELNKQRREQATKVMTAVKEALTDENRSFDSVDHLFESLGINQDIFQRAYECLARSTHVVLKRQLDEVWINQYNKKLLKCWNANIDLQFVTNAYACVVYIISYISKAEKEMGLLLGNAHREASKEGNTSAKDALKKLGSVYLHNRDVCAQEAVYRLTNMHLKECSRNVAFVPVGDNVVKMSLPLSVLKQKAESQDLTTEDMWMTSSVDRYKNRPKDSVFNDMCIATFVSEYRVLSKNQTSVNKIKLNNGFGCIVKRTRTQPAVVRYVRFSETKSPELYYQSILQLFMPYRKDVQLKPRGFETFEQFYSSGHVTLSDGLLHSVKSVVDFNRSKFEREADELDEIQNRVDNEGVREDAWCELCPEQESERLECIELRRAEKQAVDEHVENIPDLAVSREQIAHLEKRNDIMCRSDGLALLRSLNETQMCIFYQIRRWCLDKVMGKNPDPLHVFITGGAGTGKSHLIKAIQYEAMRLLSPLSSQPDDICVLLTAPTGIAAYNLHAATIHSTFSIGKDVRLPYTPLGEEKLNSLRTKFRGLQILIIDEISMVDHKLLAYIHGRLRQIKQSGDHSPFGKVSVIAVGDFFQLPPVKGKALYVEDVGVDLWSSLFRVVELKTIVRQKDPVFAELLNRVRTRSKGTQMLHSDVQILKRCETSEVSSALHIFPTNNQVNEHNIQQLFSTCPEFVEIEAQDFVNSKKTGKLELKKGHHSLTYNTCLAESLLLGVDARVMLCKNVDVLDGLVNGVCGTVTHIVYPRDENKFPHTVFVKFDDHHIGTLRRKRCANAPAVAMGSTGIEPEEERVTNKGGMRRQFPLKLAWACTVHKVQGITVDEAVVSLKNIFSPGQAYVALSRVRTLSGLVIKDFEDKVIYCRDNIKNAIQSMPLFLEETIPRYNINAHTFTVFLMNVQSLTAHVTDLALCTQQLQPNCIAVTETWLHAGSSIDAIKIDGYSFHNRPRSLCYNSNNPALIELQGQQRGGVGMFCAENLAFNIVQVPDVNLECLVYSFAAFGILIAVVYRPPSYPMALFKEHLDKLLDWMKPLSNTIAVMGDFNDDIGKSSTVCTYMTNKGFSQVVTQATTENGTLIDHVYIKTSCYDVEAVVLATYFSHHEGIVCCFNRSSDKAD